MGMKGEVIIDHSRSKMQRGTKAYSGRAIFVLCFASFFVGSFFSRPAFYWTTSSSSPDHFRACDHKRKLAEGSSNDQDQSGNHVMKEVENAHQALKSLDKTMSTLTTELATARARPRSRNTTSLVANRDEIIEAEKKMMTSSSPVLVVIGVNTAFSSRRRRDSVRETWMSAETRKTAMLKRVAMRFVIGRSSGDEESPAERDLDSEAAEHGDFLRLGDHVEGYHRLSSKTKAYFSAAVAMWPEAGFFVKVDDDVHVNPRALVNSLAAHASGIGARRRIYVGCMKSGPVLHDEAQKYYEPEFEMFGDRGNGYFRHATGQIYAVSNEVAAYIAKNAPILHTYANEDVSLGAWLLGLDVERVDDRSMCCGTPPDCEWRAQEGNVCVASFDWHCSGICNSEERMKVVHASCGEPIGALSSLDHIP